VDDHQLFREGVVELLATLPDVEVVGQAGTARDALTVVKQERPNVVLLDLDMPDTAPSPAGRADATRQIIEASPETRVVVLTMHDDARLVRELLAAGASGYLLKSAGREDLLTAIHAAAGSDDAVTMRLSRETARQLTTPVPDGSGPLTPREIAVMRLVASGESNRAIGSALHLAEATVKRHLATVFIKVDAHSRIDAVNKARALNLL